MTETVYLAIFENEKHTVHIEYLPLENGLVEIVSIDVQPRLVNTIFEQRKRRGYLVRRGLNADPRDEA